jgi:hypothetical protein
MKRQGLFIQAALALVSLVFAYFTWQRSNDGFVPDTVKVKVVDASKQSLTAARIEDGTRFNELRRTTDGESQFWVTQGYLPGKEPAPPDAGSMMDRLIADGGPSLLAPEPPPPPPPVRELRGNDRAKQLFEKLTPLEAARALGVLPAEKLAELGLSVPAGSTETLRKFELTIGGAKREFVLSRPQPGVVGTWLLDTNSKAVFLLDGNALTDLEPSSMVLVDRRLHTFTPTEFDSFKVTASEASADFVQTGSQTPQLIQVARKESPQSPDELVKNWHDKIWNRMIVTEVLGKGELPNGFIPQPVLRIDYQFKGSSKGYLEMAFDKKTGTWARSENTASWVGIHQGNEELLNEAKRFIKK